MYKLINFQQQLKGMFRQGLPSSVRSRRMSRKSSKKEKQSGVIPYRVSNGRAEVLLISSRTSKRWVIPKGGIAKAMTAADSAAS